MPEKCIAFGVMAEAADTRRVLRFQSVAEALAEAEQLAQAEADGRLKSLGNWTLGQALGHLATWANFANDGYPQIVVPPAPIRLMARLFKNHVLTKGMKPGVNGGDGSDFDRRRLAAVPCGL
jgi:EAL domain-containing protein (putative c-di-GMP-specific phosphodiesterase class I)